MKSCFISIISLIAFVSALLLVIGGGYMEALVCLLIVYVAQKLK